MSSGRARKLTTITHSDEDEDEEELIGFEDEEMYDVEEAKANVFRLMHSFNSSEKEEAFADLNRFFVKKNRDISFETKRLERLEYAQAEADNEAELSKEEVDENLRTKEFNTLKVLNSFYRMLQKYSKLSKHDLRGSKRRSTVMGKGGIGRLPENEEVDGDGNGAGQFKELQQLESVREQLQGEEAEKLKLELTVAILQAKCMEQEEMLAQGQGKAVESTSKNSFEEKAAHLLKIIVNLQEKIAGMSVESRKYEDQIEKLEAELESFRKFEKSDKALLIKEKERQVREVYEVKVKELVDKAEASSKELKELHIEHNLVTDQRDKAINVRERLLRSIQDMEGKLKAMRVAKEKAAMKNRKLEKDKLKDDVRRLAENASQETQEKQIEDRAREMAAEMAKNMANAGDGVPSDEIKEELKMLQEKNAELVQELQESETKLSSMGVMMFSQTKTAATPDPFDEPVSMKPPTAVAVCQTDHTGSIQPDPDLLESARPDVGSVGCQTEDIGYDDSDDEHHHHESAEAMAELQRQAEEAAKAEAELKAHAEDDPDDEPVPEALDQLKQRTIELEEDKKSLETEVEDLKTQLEADQGNEALITRLQELEAQKNAVDSKLARFSKRLFVMKIHDIKVSSISLLFFPFFFSSPLAKLL